MIAVSPLIERLRDTHMAHEDAYAELLASKDELKKWLDVPEKNLATRMPMIGECHRVTKICLA